MSARRASALKVMHAVFLLFPMASVSATNLKQSCTVNEGVDVAEQRCTEAPNGNDRIQYVAYFWHILVFI